jgi:hypothetical protein
MTVLGLEAPADPVGVRVKACGRKAERIFWWLQDQAEARAALPAAAAKHIIPVGEVAKGVGYNYGTTATALVALAQVGLVERLTLDGVAA